MRIKLTTNQVSIIDTAQRDNVPRRYALYQLPC